MDSQAYQPQFEPLKALLLDLTRERSTVSLLRLVADRLAARRDVALSRVWLVAPGDSVPRLPIRGGTEFDLSRER